MFQGVVIADVDVGKGDEAVNTLNGEFGAKKAVFIKTDVTKLDQLEGKFEEIFSLYKICFLIQDSKVLNDLDQLVVV